MIKVGTIRSFIAKLKSYFLGKKSDVVLNVEMTDFFEHHLPRKAHPEDAGFDLRAAITEDVVIPPGECRLIPVGFKCALPEGYELQIRPRSGLALKNYISVLNTPGTIDCNYRGEVGVILMNFGKYSYTVKISDRIAQGVVCKLPSVVIKEVKDINNFCSTRGSGGFGSTGK